MRVWVAIWTGSSAICRLVALWIAEGPLLRLVVLAVAAGFLRGWPGWDVTASTVALGWLVLAIVLGLRLPDPTAPTEPASPAPTEATDEAPEEPAPAPGGITREQLVRALHAVGAPHAHTSALADHLGAPTEAVREALAEAHIPTQGGVRMKGRKVAVSPGVRQQDFPPLPSPSEETAQEGALTSNNNDNNNDRGFETVPDETRPNRTLVRWLKAAK